MALVELATTWTPVFVFSLHECRSTVQMDWTKTFITNPWVINSMWSQFQKVVMRCKWMKILPILLSSGDRPVAFLRTMKHLFLGKMTHKWHTLLSTRRGSLSRNIGGSKSLKLINHIGNPNAIWRGLIEFQILQVSFSETSRIFYSQTNVLCDLVFVERRRIASRTSHRSTAFSQLTAVFFQKQ